MVELKQKERFEEICKLAHDTIKKTSDRYKFYAGSKLRDRQFGKAEEVFLFLPTDNNKLIVQCTGP